MQHTIYSSVSVAENVYRPKRYPVSIDCEGTMLTFKDFIPHLQEFLLSKEIESTQAVLSRLNHWISDESIEIVSVETLLIPVTNLRIISEEYPDSEQLPIATETSPGRTNEIQVFRVWYMESLASTFPATGETQRLDSDT